MTLRARHCVVGLVLAAWPAGPAGAAPEDFDVARSERAVAVGDLTDQAAFPDDSKEPLARAVTWLRDAYWRPVPSGDPRAQLARGSADLATDHALWLVRGADDATLPAPAAGRPDPFPLLTALVLDRSRREREGLPPTRTDGPLAAFASDDAIKYFLDEWAPGAYGGPAAVADRTTGPPDTEMRGDASRNLWIALGAVAGLFVLAQVGGWWIGRARTSVQSPPPSPP